MQHEKRDSIVRCGSAINNERHRAIRRRRSNKGSCPLVVAATQQNTRYGKLRQVRAATARRSINSGFFMLPLFIMYIIISLH